MKSEQDGYAYILKMYLVLPILIMLFPVHIDDAPRANPPPIKKDIETHTQNNQNITIQNNIEEDISNFIRNTKGKVSSKDTIEEIIKYLKSKATRYKMSKYTMGTVIDIVNENNNIVSTIKIYFNQSNVNTSDEDILDRYSSDMIKSNMILKDRIVKHLKNKVVAMMVYTKNEENSTNQNDNDKYILFYSDKINTIEIVSDSSEYGVKMLEKCLQNNSKGIERTK